MKLVALALCIAACGHASPPAPPASTDGRAQKFTIGVWDAYALDDGTITLPTTAFVEGHPEAADVLAAAGAERDNVHLDVHPLLVKANGRVLLFDTGAGNAAFAKAGKLPRALAAAGVTAAQVTDIFISHGHGDHVLGLVANNALAFPSATIHLTKPEWETLQASEEDKALVATIAQKVDAFEPGAQLTPEVTAIDTRGHTPGHSSYLIGGELFYLGDVAHSSILSVQRPAWSNSFDHDKPAAEAMRQQVLDKLAADHTRVFAVHFPFPGVGHVERAGDQLVWKAE